MMLRNGLPESARARRAQLSRSRQGSAKGCLPQRAPSSIPLLAAAPPRRRADSAPSPLRCHRLVSLLLVLKKKK